MNMIIQLVASNLSKLSHNFYSINSKKKSHQTYSYNIICSTVNQLEKEI